uniref:Uncharacterized protein n=1 Tax=uncultured marine Nitrospinaceae bacterium TaxID=482920 RepID=A4GJ46_9BACT|nr:hypothetical protein [uncultured marine Nitrospinaceae bacterium]
MIASNLSKLEYIFSSQPKRQASSGALIFFVDLKLSMAMKAVINAVGEGEVTPNEAQVVSSVIEVYRKVIETTELESRIIELEKVSNE